MLLGIRATGSTWVNQVLALLREHQDNPRGLPIGQILDLCPFVTRGLLFGSFSVTFAEETKARRRTKCLSTWPLRCLLALLWLTAAACVAGPIATFFFADVEWRLVAVFAVPSVFWVFGWLLKVNLEAQFETVYGLTLRQQISKEAYTGAEMLVHCLAGVWAIQSLPWWARYWRLTVIGQESNDVSKVIGRPLILAAIRVVEKWDLLARQDDGAATHQQSIRTEIDNQLSPAASHLEKLKDGWMWMAIFPSDVLDKVGKPAMAFGGAGVLLYLFLLFNRP